MSRLVCRRRTILGLSTNVALIACGILPDVFENSAVAKQSQSTKKVLSKREWMAAWMDSPSARDVIGQLWLGRFLDEMYFLLKPIAWRPNATQSGHTAVEVPAGFVTDLASIPWPLWSAGLRPDGQYVFAAIVHDYLYWSQTTTRKEADTILKLGMEDLRVGYLTIEAIYNGVRAGGGSAWTQNAKLKARGEKRFLNKIPDTATITWGDWKKQPDVFGDQ